MQREFRSCYIATHPFYPYRCRATDKNQYAHGPGVPSVGVFSCMIGRYSDLRNDSVRSLSPYSYCSYFGSETLWLLSGMRDKHLAQRLKLASLLNASEVIIVDTLWT